MPLISTLGAASSRGFGEFNQQAQGKYIEDYFSTYLYNGTGSAQTIPSGIGLADTAEWSTIKTQQNVSYTNDVKIDSGGNIVSVGIANDGTRTYGFVAKYNPSGSLQWQRKLYLSGYSTFLYDVGIDSSDNIYVGGWASSATTVPLFAKYNSSGTIQWQRSLVQTGQFARIRGIALDSSGNVYTAGLGNDGTRDVIQFAKYNTSGTLQWQRKIYQTGATSGNGNIIAIDSSDNIYLTSSSNDGIRNYAIIAKYNTSGVIQWQKKYYDSTGSGQGITTDSSGNVYAFLLANDGITGTLRFLLKYDATGALQWQRKFGGSSNEAYGVYTDSSGDVYCIGRGDDGTGAACQVFKYNSSGTLQWQKGLKESTTWGYQGAVSGDNLFVTGYATSNSVAYGFTSKLRTDGTTQSGAAFVTLFTTVETSATATGTSTVGTATDAAGTATDSAGTFTDEAGTTTSSLATQVAVSGAGGLVWLKQRDGSAVHALYDTSRGATYQLSTDNTNAQLNNTTGLTSFNANGFSIGSSATINTNGSIYASWTFREKANFFDIVSYTGDGVNGRQIPHGLGSSPGMVIVKCSDTAGTQWALWHKDFLADTVVFLNGSVSYYLVGNTTYGGITSANSTTFTATIGAAGIDNVNANGKTYVAYLFAHNAGGFGLNGSENVISCGSYTGNGSTTGPSINLGWEPQFLFIRAYSGNGSAILFDNVRGITTSGSDFGIKVDGSDESAAGYLDINSTGFQIKSTDTSVNANTVTYIYMAIRRGPMKVPTDATTVFQPTVYTGTNVDNRLVNTTIAPDTVWVRQRSSNTVGGMVVGDRVRGQPYLLTGSTAAEVTTADAFDAQIVSATEYGTAFSSMNGVWVGNDPTSQLNASTTASNQIAEAFKRAPGFHDIVCYTGTGVNRTVNHNLGVPPQLMLIKARSFASSWQVYPNDPSQALILETNSAAFSGSTRWNDTAPTSSVFSLGTASGVNNAGGGLFVAYLFASCPGVSKVGTYTGTGTTLQINCGFSSGARFVLIKRTDSAGAWYVYDSARGIVAGNDPYIRLNLTASEVTSTDYVDTYSAGFELSSTAPAELNAVGGSYIFLAIA